MLVTILSTATIFGLTVLIGLAWSKSISKHYEETGFA
jgi:hypothetical protein